MNLKRLHITFRFCLGLLLIWSPMASANAASPNVSAGGYLCSPSGRAPSTEAQAHLQDFLILAGALKGGGDTEQFHHCPDCFLMVLGLIVQKPFQAVPFRFSRVLTHYFTIFNGFHFKSTGPPLGGRAPPPLSLIYLILLARLPRKSKLLKDSQNEKTYALGGDSPFAVYPSHRVCT